jgi:putative ABC transport system permease protein
VVQDVDGASLEVVGVAADVGSQRLGENDGPSFYRVRDTQTYGDAVVLRFEGDTASAQSAVRHLLRDLDQDLLPHIETLQSQADTLSAAFWKLTRMVLFLGAVAIVLAIIGIYGVVAFSVSRRTGEMGIRMALGATRTDILVAVIASSLRPVAYGLLAGILLSVVGAAVLAQSLRAIPITVDVTDPVAYVTVLLILGSTAVAAMLGPA